MRGADRLISATTKPMKPTSALTAGPRSAICARAEVKVPVKPVKATRSSAWPGNASKVGNRVRASRPMKPSQRRAASASAA